jgi:hypothetical protein
VASPEPNLTYFSPKVEKRESRIEGRGLFAKQAIKAGEVVVVKGGYVMTKAQRDAIGEELGPAEIQITEELFIGPITGRQREGGMMRAQSRAARPGRLHRVTRHRAR